MRDTSNTLTTGLQLTGLAKSFLGSKVIHDLTLAAEPGEILALTGPSGAGKSTTMRLVAGLARPDTGTLSLAGANLGALPPEQRNIAMMFESYALYPNLTVAENIAFSFTSPSGRQRYGAHDMTGRLTEFLEMAQIAHLRDRAPGGLSGGQKQRVALCRALAQDADLYLMDEPISHLDAKLRNELRGFIRRRQTRLAVPTVWATPDAMEALSVADKVAVLIDGRVEQFGPPEEIYATPATANVARLVGDPAMNLVPGRVSTQGTGLRFDGANMSLMVPPELAARVVGAGVRDVILGLRPGALRPLAAPGDPTAISVQVYAWEPFGKYSLITVQSDGVLLRIKTPLRDRFDANQTIEITADPSNLILFDAKTQAAL
jgi:multiple sugar transport system ATP-binding protein